jgi:hypothetical protein
MWKPEVSQKPEPIHEAPGLRGIRVFADVYSSLMNILASCFWFLASNENRILVATRTAV